jgi:ech hydrogenase subunit C
MPEPKVVISCGACASTGGVFRGMYNCEGGVDQFIPVDVYVCGCGTRPEQIIDGVVQALGILEKKTKALEESVKLNKEAWQEDGQLNRRNIADEIKPLLA